MRDQSYKYGVLQSWWIYIYIVESFLMVLDCDSVPLTQLQGKTVSKSLRNVFVGIQKWLLCKVHQSHHPISSSMWFQIILILALIAASAESNFVEPAWFSLERSRKSEFQFTLGPANSFLP